MASGRETADVESADGDIASIAGVIHQKRGMTFGECEIGTIISRNEIGQKRVLGIEIIKKHGNTSFQV